MNKEFVDDYCALIINKTPILDVRAPTEFQAGHLPFAVNCPILYDDEREQVGTCYKKQGRDAAVMLGHELVSGENKKNKVAAWKSFYHQYPNGVISCARGGMRSKLAQLWLNETQITKPRVRLGYKALRNFLLEKLDVVSQHPMLIISGNTGTGKTDLLKLFRENIDLEGLANHHGSAFGKNITAQPAQATFENYLIVECLQKLSLGTWLVEDESRNIGKIYLPEEFYLAMSQSPLVMVEESLESRLNHISGSYFRNMSAQYKDKYGEERGWYEYCHYLISALGMLKKKLGLERYQVLLHSMQEALAIQLSTGSVLSHYSWLAPLLTDYYDPMYNYKIEQKNTRLLFKGNFNESKEFVTHYTATHA